MTVAKLTEGLNLIKVGMTDLENSDAGEQSIASTRKSLENSLCCYKELLRDRKPVQTSLQDFFSHAQKL